MTKQHRDEDRQLHTLERWRRLELETAQAEHVARQEQAQERQAQRDQVQDVIERTQEFARTQCDSGAPLSAESLRLANQFSQVQRQALAAADSALKESNDAVDAAHSEVVSRSENLFGIEKLRERRREQTTREALQAAQTQLDEHALLRLSGGEATNKRNP